MDGHVESRMESWRGFVPYLWGLFAMGCGCLFLVVAYAWTNRSGHTGVNLLLFEAFFFPLILVGAVAVRLGGRNRGAKKAALACGLSGIFGAGLPFFLSTTGILRDYESWLKAGQPAASPNAHLLIGMYLGVFGIALGFLLLHRLPSDDA